MLQGKTNKVPFRGGDGEGWWSRCVRQRGENVPSHVRGCTFDFLSVGHLRHNWELGSRIVSFEGSD